MFDADTALSYGTNPVIQFSEISNYASKIAIAKILSVSRSLGFCCWDYNEFVYDGWLAYAPHAAANTWGQTAGLQLDNDSDGIMYAWEFSNKICCFFVAFAVSSFLLRV